MHDLTGVGLPPMPTKPYATFEPAFAGTLNSNPFLSMQLAPCSVVTCHPTSLHSGPCCSTRRDKSCGSCSCNAAVSVEERSPGAEQVTTNSSCTRTEANGRGWGASNHVHSRMVILARHSSIISTATSPLTSSSDKAAAIGPIFKGTVKRLSSSWAATTAEEGVGVEELEELDAGECAADDHVHEGVSADAAALALP